MPVGTGAITLQQVCDEIGGAQTSLQNCVDDANSAGYDPTYYTAPATSLAEFRGYDDNPVNVTLAPISAIRSAAAGSFGLTTTVTGGTAAWTATDNVSWITLTGTTSSSSTGSFTCNYTSNPGPSTRFGTITVTWSGTNRTCSVVQNP